MTRSARAAQPLISASGLFWERDAIEWGAPRGQTFQLLGRRGTNRPGLEFCDFRRARGVYVLFNNHGPTYVGRARGEEGFGSRLRAHHRDGFKNWVRFCWFSFDPVRPRIGAEMAGWCEPVKDDGSNAVGTNTAIDELEALMISAFGLAGQNQMGLRCGKPWKQVTVKDCVEGGRARKVDASPIRMRTLRSALET